MHLRYEGWTGGVRWVRVGVVRRALFLAGESKHVLSGQIAFREPKESQVGCPECSGQRRVEKRGRYLNIICVQAVIESGSMGEPVFRE